MASARYFKHQLVKKYSLGPPETNMSKTNKYGLGENEEEINRDLERIFNFLTSKIDNGDEVINQVQESNKKFNKIVPGTRIDQVGKHDLSYWEQEKERKIKSKSRSRQNDRKRENMLERARRRFAEKQGIAPIEIPKYIPKSVKKQDQPRFKRVPLTLTTSK
jgi:hypothetical protein